MIYDNDNKIGQFTYRMIGSILTSFCREFGHENIRKILKFIVEHEPFWELTKAIEDNDPMVPPWKRNAHDFLEDDND